METPPEKNRILEAQNDYAARWAGNSSAIEKQGGYDWMATQLLVEKPSRVLDIGCGLGHGVAALLGKNPALDIVALDELSACLYQTEIRLRDAGFACERNDRLSFVPGAGGAYRVDVHSAIPPRTRKITLVQANAAAPDEALLKFMATLPPFDAITLWLIGSHQLRAHGVDAVKMRVASAGDYRLMVQNRVYDLADQVLRVGGVLNIVDREGSPIEPKENRRHMELCLEGHRDQAAPTRLCVEKIASLPYEEDGGVSGVEMVYAKPKDGSPFGKYRMALYSVMSRKK